MVGDSEQDILFAKNAGLRACWCSYGYGNEDACRALAPEFILPEVSRLPAMIAGLR
jgi:phosphoglycolate phosphatase-like HAD superfamily hydrolase